MDVRSSLTNPVQSLDHINCQRLMSLIPATVPCLPDKTADYLKTYAKNKDSAALDPSSKLIKFQLGEGPVTAPKAPPPPAKAESPPPPPAE